MMKKVYHAPELEIEVYQLDARIANNCSFKVTFGPGLVDGDGKISDMCDEFGDSWAVAFASTDTSFYEEGTACTCYYSAGGEGYFSS